MPRLVYKITLFTAVILLITLFYNTNIIVFLNVAMQFGNNFLAKNSQNFTSDNPLSSKIDNPLANSLRSNEVTCQFPNLPVDDPEISKFLIKYGSLKCNPSPDWVSTAGGKFHITPEAAEAHGKINCNYSSIIRHRNGRDSFIMQNFLNYTSGSPLLTEAFVARCKADDGSKYNNVHAGVPLKINVIDRLEKARQAAPKSLNMSIYIYMVDSMSHVNFRRKCPKTYSLLTEEMGGLAMNGFNVVGDGTPFAMIPMLTGKFQTELPEGRKRFANSSFLDDWPVIFRDFNASGYVTSFAEEIADYGFWIYKLKGFRDPPADYWLQTFEKATIGKRGWFPPFCQGHLPRALTLCRFWEELQSIYEPKGLRTFSALLSGETSHDDYNKVQGLDEHWVRMFKTQFKAGMFNNTMLIFMGDHGRRFGPVRQTQSGKLEEKLPLLVTVMPPWFKKQHPEIWRNMQANTNRLVTVFDLYVTFQNVINFNPNFNPTPALALLQQRGISLFDEVPPERTCAQAWIGPHYCSCLSWENIRKPNSHATVGKAVEHVIFELNRILAQADGLCSRLALENILYARKLFPDNRLLAYAGTLDYDNLVPELEDSPPASAIEYEIGFVTKPNGAHFEGLIRHLPNVRGSEASRGKKTLRTKRGADSDSEFLFSFSDLSRLDKYHGQSACIEKTHHNLKPYCFCKNYNSTE